MGLFSKKDKNVTCAFKHYDGLDGIYKGATLEVEQDDENKYLSIKQSLSKRDPILLKYGQICAVGILSEKEIIEQNKSVIGRAAVGGLLLGPVGAVVGGISGTGKKTEEKVKNCLVINYHPSANPDEIKSVSLEILGYNWNKFMLALKEKANIVESKSQYL
mgnify:CR=1 FL=1